MKGLAFGALCPGWTPRGWALRLEYLAGRCERDHSQQAEQYRAWAAQVLREAGLTADKPAETTAADLAPGG